MKPKPNWDRWCCWFLFTCSITPRYGVPMSTLHRHRRPNCEIPCTFCTYFTVLSTSLYPTLELGELNNVAVMWQAKDSTLRLSSSLIKENILQRYCPKAHSAPFKNTHSEHVVRLWKILASKNPGKVGTALAVFWIQHEPVQQYLSSKGLRGGWRKMEKGGRGCRGEEGGTNMLTITSSSPHTLHPCPP